MKLIYSILTILLLLAFCWSCGETSSKEVPGKADSATTAPALSQLSDGQISKERFNEMLHSVKNPQLLDVRTSEEYKAGSITGCLNIDFYSEEFSNQLKALDPARPVFIYCKSGGRSGKTYKMLKDMGVEKVYDLKGGYDGWK